MTYFFEPPQSWGNLNDCGLECDLEGNCIPFPCTGPKNTIFSFKGIKWIDSEGNPDTQTNALENFSLIPSIPGYTDNFPDCTKLEAINGHICTNNDLGILVWESQDPDSIDRSIQPILLRYNKDPTKENKLNSFMDHNCDSFYNSQQRISRFPGLIYAPPNEVGSKLEYEVFMTGTPPEKMKWKLDITNLDSGMIVYVKFPSALARAILVDGEEVSYNKRVADPENPGQNVPGPVQGESCGENRYIPVDNVLEFYISGMCELEVRPRDAIMTKVRMEWTMEEFFEEGGTTAFVDRLAASLGIHASAIKVVGVAEGSVSVEYEITPSPDEPLSLAQIQAR